MTATAVSAERDTAVFLARVVGWVMAAAGLVGLVAASVLMVEKVWLLEDPAHVPSCSIDAVLSCGSVMTSEQAEAFGFPNPILGIAGFAALLALGAAVLSGGVLARWLWLAIQAGVTFAVVFVHWLFFQSVYDIEALCPYCMVVWVAAIVAFVYVTLANVSAGRLPVPRSLSRVANALVRNHGVVVTVWLALLTLLIGEAFWDHWRSQF